MPFACWAPHGTTENNAEIVRLYKKPKEEFRQAYM
jgi:hypothetical protein